MKPLPIPIPYDLADVLETDPTNICHINAGRRRLPIAKCIRLMEIAGEDSRLKGLCFIHLRPELKPALPYLCPERRNRLLFTMDDKTTDIIGIVNERIQVLLDSLDMRPLHLSHKTGIDDAIIYKCLNGKRKWNIGHLQKIAPVLGVTLGYLFQETIMVPRAGGDYITVS
jgi:hypothetical protein